MPRMRHRIIGRDSKFRIPPNNSRSAIHRILKFQTKKKLCLTEEFSQQNKKIKKREKNSVAHQSQGCATELLGGIQNFESRPIILWRTLAGAPPFEQAWCFVGAPPGVVADAPLIQASYAERWRRWTGLQLPTLVSGSPAAQRAERARFVVSPAVPYSPSRHALAPMRTHLSRTRTGLARRYERWGLWRESTVLDPASGSSRGAR